MASWILCLLLWTGVSRPDDAAWQFQLQRLHSGIGSQSWFEAKQALNRLESLNNERYIDLRFDLTKAWIATREGHWDLAVRLHRKLGITEAWAALEVADNLVRLSRFQEALALLSNFRKRFSSREAIMAKQLQAHCLREMGRTEDAIRVNRALTKSRVPAKDRIQAYHNLIELYYETKQNLSARRIAESLQNNQPGSDAALYTVALQEAREDAVYLNRLSTWRRFARVSYDNRDFKKSDLYFRKIRDANAGYESARARYFLARTLTKRNRNTKALEVFEQDLPALQGTGFGGPAAFQYARVLFMNNRDREVVEFVRQYRQVGNSQKWRWECHQLLILALRRLNDYPAFLEEGLDLRRGGAPAWLQRFYHRNGLMWNMAEGDSAEAFNHLNRYKRFGLRGSDRQEALVWEGLIQWTLGEQEEAVNAWLAVANRDPNHYFGLVARECLERAGKRSPLWWQYWHAAGNRLDELPLDAVRRLYYLAPNDAFRATIGKVLQSHSPAPFQRESELDLGSQAGRFAYIGRFDRAAVSSDIGGTNTSRQFHRARWYKLAHNIHASVRHGESLAKNFPRWMPLELLPRPVQELAYPSAFEEIIKDRASEFEVDPYLLLAIIREESRFDAGAKSWASARGLMQFIPSTAREIAGEIPELTGFTLPMLYDPKTSITLGAKYLDNLLETFDGEALFSVAAYNAGEGAVVRWRDMTQASDPLLFVGDVTYEQTKNYCQKVLRAYHHYSRVYRQTEPDIIHPPKFVGASGL